ncbi:MAG TPA: YqgE/AlgH family protein [Parvularculaceae bacterium]|nr:YqgE/AlgH family protein [Parvularculaceae bacterium]HNS86684.1 YqgE/AlgH family protein [Parvularculaceae bacterium]
MSAAGRQDFLAGKLLIAMPNMTDPRFEKSVILMVSHDADHAMGVVINKPLADIELGDLLEQLEIDPRQGSGGDPVFYGGPMQTDRGLVVHTLDYHSSLTMPVGADVGVTASKEILVDIGGANAARKPPSHYLLVIGHAGWGPGQLESEIAVNAWCHSNADAGLIFGAENRDLWSAALKSLGVTSAMFSPEWSNARADDAPLN